MIQNSQAQILNTIPSNRVLAGQLVNIKKQESCCAWTYRAAMLLRDALVLLICSFFLHMPPANRWDNHLFSGRSRVTERGDSRERARRWRGRADWRMRPDYLVLSFFLSLPSLTCFHLCRETYGLYFNTGLWSPQTGIGENHTQRQPDFKTLELFHLSCPPTPLPSSWVDYYCSSKTEKYRRAKEAHPSLMPRTFCRRLFSTKTERWTTREFP